MLNIYRYIFNIVFLIFLFSAGAFAQTKEEKKDTVSGPFFQGFRIETDIVPLVTTIAGSDTYNYEAAIQFYLRNNLYPAFEAGFGGADKTLYSGINFKGSGLYYRLGTDFNLMKSKPGGKMNNNLLLVGARLGFSGFGYDLNNLTVPGNYWNETIKKDLTDQNFFGMWLELGASLRVELSKNIFIGWNIRTKNLLLKPDTGDYKPWYIPGYGITDDTSFGFNYLIGYKF
jgi:hypothetical protein